MPASCNQYCNTLWLHHKQVQYDPLLSWACSYCKHAAHIWCVISRYICQIVMLISGFPAGLIDDNEEPEYVSKHDALLLISFTDTVRAAAIRETKEEAGFHNHEVLSKNHQAHPKCPEWVVAEWWVWSADSLMKPPIVWVFSTQENNKSQVEVVK